MMNRIVHRGPNSAGEYIDQSVALGFRRLSIIDLEGGSQPIYNEDRTKIIIFNGEIYNYQPLREELIKAGHIFSKPTQIQKSCCMDMKNGGTDLLQKVRGCSHLLFGIMKKMNYLGHVTILVSNHYYAEMNGTFMFGSEIKRVFTTSDFKKN